MSASALSSNQTINEMYENAKSICRWSQCEYVSGCMCLVVCVSVWHSKAQLPLLCFQFMKFHRVHANVYKQTRATEK